MLRNLFFSNWWHCLGLHASHQFREIPHYSCEITLDLLPLWIGFKVKCTTVTSLSTLCSVIVGEYVMDNTEESFRYNFKKADSDSWAVHHYVIDDAAVISNRAVFEAYIITNIRRVRARISEDIWTNTREIFELKSRHLWNR